ncbi:hypothetical protein [Thermofilum pendens]|uniref:Uncharacterized protein n=1 Tax=Thermofilum pendens (strain DSM 2475 / Hrk 5) TaxID=368408 RepID=A1RYC2_THEPD|nr:hypothetical protein [Thermofilum pendens]ABL78202.1 hypothetical protein Tpen_0800 [Thermofilum pendens Hrk 5]
MSSKLDARERKLLYLLQVYGRPISRKALHRLVRIVQEKYGVDMGFSFSQDAAFSKELDAVLQKLAEEDYVKVLYAAGGRFLTLYKPLYALGKRGAAALSKKELAKTDAEKLEKAVAEVLGRGQGVEAPSQ